MSLILAIFAHLKARYQRLLQWERFALIREREWLFALQGSADDFEQRFNDDVIQTSRDEFFRLSSWTEDHDVFGFCIADEVALKVPRPSIASFLFLWPVYHFHGSLIRDNGQIYLYGHHRADRIANWALHAANLYYLICAAWLVKTVVAVSLGLPTDGEPHRIFGSFVQPVFIAAIWTLWLLIYARIIEGWARPVHAEIHRVLAEICGNSAAQLKP